MSKLDISLIPSSKSKPMLNINNHLFYKRNERSNGDIYWTCRYARKNCPAAITTVGLTTEIRSMFISHVGHSAEYVASLIIREKLEICKKRAVNEKVPIQQIYREEMVKALTEHKKPEIM